MKQNHVTVTKTIEDTKAYKSLATENKFLDPFWMWGQSTPN